jgi:hypothetical protein
MVQKKGKYIFFLWAWKYADLSFNVKIFSKTNYAAFMETLFNLRKQQVSKKYFENQKQCKKMT